MITKYFVRLLSPVLIGCVLVVCSACNKTTKSGGVDSAEAAKLEAQANKGDGDAAYKLGELYGADAGNHESAIKSAVWFSVAGHYGNPSAKTALDGITRTLNDADKLEVEKQVAALKFPTPAK